jgi:hypothetical protein
MSGGKDTFAVRSVRLVLAIFVAVALFFIGLLWLEGSGPSPVRPLRVLSARQSVGGASGPVGRGTIFRSVGIAATVSGAPPPTSQITTTSAGGGEVICQQFVAGTATTLLTVVYDTKGTTINKVITPGQFWYWVSIQAASAGPQTFTITEASTYVPTSGSPFLTLGSGTTAYDSGCNPLAASVSGGTARNPAVTVSFDAPAAGTYIIGVKQATHSIIGSGPASTTSGFSYNYTYATIGVSGSTQGLNLTHQ